MLVSRTTHASSGFRMMTTTNWEAWSIAPCQRSFGLFLGFVNSNPSTWSIDTNKESYSIISSRYWSRLLFWPLTRQCQNGRTISCLLNNTGSSTRSGRIQVVLPERYQSPLPSHYSLRVQVFRLSDCWRMGQYGFFAGRSKPCTFPNCIPPTVIHGVVGACWQYGICESMSPRLLRLFAQRAV
jgi:hypothetical protein